MLDALVCSISSRDLRQYIYEMTCEIHLQELVRLGNRLFVVLVETQRQLEWMTTAYDAELRRYLTSIFDGEEYDLAVLELYLVFRNLGGHQTARYQDLSGEQREVSRLLQQRYVRTFMIEICHQSWLIVYLRNRTPTGRSQLTRRDVLQSINLMSREIKVCYRTRELLPHLHHIKSRLYQYMIGWTAQYFASWRFWVSRRFCLIPRTLLPVADRFLRHKEAVQTFLDADLNPSAGVE